MKTSTIIGLSVLGIGGAFAGYMYYESQQRKKALLALQQINAPAAANASGLTTMQILQQIASTPTARSLYSK